MRHTWPSACEALREHPADRLSPSGPEGATHGGGQRAALRRGPDLHEMASVEEVDLFGSERGSLLGVHRAARDDLRGAVTLDVIHDITLEANDDALLRQREYGGDRLTQLTEGCVPPDVAMAVVAARAQPEPQRPERRTESERRAGGVAALATGGNPPRMAWSTGAGGTHMRTRRGRPSSGISISRPGGTTCCGVSCCHS